MPRLRTVVPFILISSLAISPSPGAQAAAAKSREQMKAAYEAHRADFDYLLGDWEFTGLRHEPSGEIKFHGFWSAARIGEGSQLIDEYRVVGDDGETYYVSTTLRAYNAALDQWELVSSEAGTGLANRGSGRRSGAEMRIEQRFGPSLWRIRYHDIQPDRFLWAADRSLDDGKTWVTNFQTIEARRTGPAKALGPLTSAKKAGG